MGKRVVEGRAAKEEMNGRVSNGEEPIAFRGEREPRWKGRKRLDCVVLHTKPLNLTKNRPQTEKKILVSWRKSPIRNPIN